MLFCLKSVKNGQWGVFMLNREREQEIINILKDKNGFVTVKELCRLLFASESSIRRDLKTLEERGLVKRSYGGATAVMNFSNISTFSQRTRENIVAKREIAQKAAALINEGDIIFLDQSSTAFYLAAAIMEKSSVTVATNNIEIMMLLSNSNIKVISSGGSLSDENRNCLVGGEAQNTFGGIFADIAFFSVRALDDGGIVSDCSLEEIAIRRAMLKNARKRVLLCDSTKFGARAPFKQCDLNEIDCLISDGNASRLFAGRFNDIVLM